MTPMLDPSETLAQLSASPTCQALRLHASEPLDEAQSVARPAHGAASSVEAIRPSLAHAPARRRVKGSPEAPGWS